jgi:heterodisulfide reductase subunit C
VDRSAPNGNNNLLAQGCEKLGYHHARVPRNVKGCGNTGQCGNGCPLTDRKFNRMRPSMARVFGLETRSVKAG